MAREPRTLRDPGLLEAALEGLTLQRQRIEGQIREVRALLGRRRAGAASPAEDTVATGRKRELSDAARKRIAAAQKKRWAEYRKQAKQQ